MRWKSVVLPAPFGPMSPTTSPGATSRLAPRTAWSPPNRFRTPATSGTVTTGGGGPTRPDARKMRIDARSQEQDDANQEHAVHHQVESRPSGAGEVDPGALGERREDQRAQERSEQRPRPSDHGADDDV